MRTLLLGILIAAAIPAVADDASLSGKWQIQRNAAGRESTQDCTFTQKSNDLTGSCTTDRGKVEISGKVTGKAVNWTYKSDSEGGAVTVIYEGTIASANKITGKVTAVEFAVEGEFMATRAR